MDRYGTSRLRASAEAQGYPVTGEQFRDYLNAGLLPPGEGPGVRKTWPPEVVDMLLAIRALGETVRPLGRRVICLYGHPLFPHITPERVGAAMVAILPTMRDASVKLTLLRAANEELQHGKTFEVLCFEHPAHERWPAILELLAPLVPLQIDGWYAQVRRLESQADVYLLQPDGAPIPFEEQVTLLALDNLLDLARRMIEETRIWLEQAA